MKKKKGFPISRDNHGTMPLYVILSEVEVLLDYYPKTQAIRESPLQETKTPRAQRGAESYFHSPIDSFFSCSRRSVSSLSKRPFRMSLFLIR